MGIELELGELLIIQLLARGGNGRSSGTRFFHKKVATWSKELE